MVGVWCFARTGHCVHCFLADAAAAGAFLLPCTGALLVVGVVAHFVTEKHLVHLVEPRSSCFGFGLQCTVLVSIVSSLLA